MHTNKVENYEWKYLIKDKETAVGSVLFPNAKRGGKIMKSIIYKN